MPNRACINLRFCCKHGGNAIKTKYCSADILCQLISWQLWGSYETKYCSADILCQLISWQLNLMAVIHWFRFSTDKIGSLRDPRWAAAACIHVITPVTTQSIFFVELRVCPLKLCTYLSRITHKWVASKFFAGSVAPLHYYHGLWRNTRCMEAFCSAAQPNITETCCFATGELLFQFCWEADTKGQIWIFEVKPRCSCGMSKQVCDFVQRLGPDAYFSWISQLWNCKSVEFKKIMKT